MLSPLRGWRIAVQYHFLIGHSSCGDAVICRVEQFSTPKKPNAFVSLAHALTRRVTKNPQPGSVSK